MKAAPRHLFSHVITVGPEAIDDLGHVNNAEYLRYFEACARAHADSVGAGMDFMRAHGVVPVARQHVIKYHKPAQLGERLTVSTEITQAQGVRARRHNEARRVANGELLAEMDTDWVWVDPARGRPRALPGALIEAFGWPPKED